MMASKWKTYRAYSMKWNGVARYGSSAFWPSGKWTPTHLTFRGRNQQEAQRKAERFWVKAEFGGFVEVREVL